MTSIATFIFLVAIPIWCIAEIVVRWIESWDTAESEDPVSIASAQDMARRITRLEEVLKADRSDLARDGQK